MGLTGAQVSFDKAGQVAYGCEKSTHPLFATRHNCLVTIPLYSTREIYDKLGTVAFAEEVVLRQRVIEMLRTNGVTAHDSLSVSDNCVNEVHIGGPLTNDRAWTLFLNHFPSFKYQLHEKTVDVLPERIRDSRADIIRKIDNGSQEGFIVGDSIDSTHRFVRFDNTRNDCAIIAKLVPSDFMSEVKKTVYFMFGSRLRGAEAAVDYFLQSSEYLNKRFEGGHFLVSLNVNNEDATVDLSKDFTDLTDIVFKGGVDD